MSMFKPKILKLKNVGDDELLLNDYLKQSKLTLETLCDFDDLEFVCDLDNGSNYIMGYLNGFKQLIGPVIDISFYKITFHLFMMLYTYFTDKNGETDIISKSSTDWILLNNRLLEANNGM